MTYMHSSSQLHLRRQSARSCKRRNITYITDPTLEPEQKLIIAIFKRARIDLFSRSGQVAEKAASFLAAYGYDIEEIRAAWEGKRQI
jgi:hypothetical protein